LRTSIEMATQSEAKPLVLKAEALLSRMLAEEADD
jgi:hypothetical protein